MNNAGRYFLVSMALLALSYPMVLADTLELSVTEPVALVGSPGPVRLPRTFEQLWVFGTSSTGFPRSMVDPRWRPGSDWDNRTELNNFNPSRWYQAPIDPSWKPQPAFTEDDDVTNFNPSRWQMGTLDPNWYPEDGFKRRDVSSSSE